MKKLIYIFILVLSFPLLLAANGIDHEGPKKKRKGKKKNIEMVRADRKIALTATSGYNSLSAAGIVGTYYVQPRIGVDVGAGIGLKGGKLGVRGRYMLSNRNFSPHVGLGIMQSLISTDGVITTDEITGEVIVFDLNPTTFLQLITGFEYMSNGGFVIGLNIGYAIAMNESFTVVEGNVDEDFETVTNAIFGSGIVAEFSIGYSF